MKHLLCEEMVEKFENSENSESANTLTGNSSNKRNTIQVVDDTVIQQEDKKSGCC